MKIAYINTIMEMCTYLPNTDVDAVSAGIALATKRLISPAYLKGGMGDGGGCHPRDNIAMSWLADKLGLRFNFFDSIMMAREKQTDFLADLIQKELIARPGLPVVILGKAFKPDTNLVTGSPAVLLGHILVEREVQFSYADPYCCTGRAAELPTAASKPAVYFVGCKHSVFASVQFPAGAVVIDPHRYIPRSDPAVIVRYVGVCGLPATAATGAAAH